MSKVVFPKLEELYIVITNDWYINFLIQANKDAKNSVKEFYMQRTNKADIINILNLLKGFMSKSEPKDKKYSSITSFTSIYLNKILNFFSQKEVINIEVKLAHQYCLAYIALAGLECFFINLDDDELFGFHLIKYKNYSNFLEKYTLSTSMKNFYEKNSTQLKQNNNIETNQYLNLIITFDADYQFSPQLISEKQSINEGIENNDYKAINQEKVFIESNNGRELNTTQDDSEKKTKINNKSENDNNNLIENSKDNISNINIDNNNTENKKDSSTKNNLNENTKTIEIDQDKNKYKNVEKNNITIKRENIINEIDKNEIQKKISDLNIRLYNLEFELKKSDFEAIKEKYDLLEESIFYSAYFNIAKKKIEYLETYIKSLKNILVNLSNPYNFNLWRKIVNIILKNLFIILKKKKFQIKQNKDLSTLQQLKSIIAKMDLSSQIRLRYIHKLEIYEKDLNSNKKTQTKNSSPSADKERTFNLITIKNNQKNDIISSLSTDFLFYLKEKGNKIDHFDESILNLVLFNDLNISENDEIEIEETKINKAKIQVVKECEIKNDESKNEIKNATNNIKNLDEKEEIINQTKNGILKGNEKKNKILKITKINEKEYKEMKEDEKKSQQIIDKEEKIFEKKNETKSKYKNENKEEKTDGIEYLNKKYEGKKIFNGNELIEMLKNPLKFQLKNIQKKNIFEEIYKKIDVLKKDIGYKKKENKMVEILENSKYLESRIQKLMKNIEIDIKTDCINNNIIIENIKEINKNGKIDPTLKVKIDKYIELESLSFDVNNKIKVYEENNKKFVELNELIINNEKEVNDYINKIQVKIEKGSELIKITDIFNEYKSVLINNMLNKPEYKEHSDIFNKRNIDNYKIDDFYNFLKNHLKDYTFSIAKRDITNYNLFVEILNSFEELKYRYNNNVDINI